MISFENVIVILYLNMLLSLLKKDFIIHDNRFDWPEPDEDINQMIDMVSEFDRKV